MTDSHADDLSRRAAEWLRMAELGQADKRFDAAYECARTACELSGKALLQRKLGRYPRTHEIQGDLFREELIPASVSAKRLSDLLSDVTRGTYGVGPKVTAKEVEIAIGLAGRMVADASQKS